MLIGYLYLEVLHHAYTHICSLNMCIVLVFFIKMGFLLWYRYLFSIRLKIWYHPITTW